VDISQIIREMAEQFASRAEQSNRVLSLELPEEEILVLGNDVQLRQVFNNLLENALKFTHENDSINVSVENLQNEIKIVIKDSGVGISSEDLPHMFERFHRGRNASEFSGNGLGLAIVKAIVEGHGGEVGAASSGIGNGSEFTVRLPTRL
jgi:signal transduction histidine kinase